MFMTKKTYQKYSKTNCKEKNCIIMVIEDVPCLMFFLKHNHDLCPKKSSFQRSHKKMDSYAKRRIKLNDYVGITLNKSFHSLVVKAIGYGCM